MAKSQNPVSKSPWIQVPSFERNQMILTSQTCCHNREKLQLKEASISFIAELKLEPMTRISQNKTLLTSENCDEH